MQVYIPNRRKVIGNNVKFILALKTRRKAICTIGSFVDATVAYNGSCKINGASAVLRARLRHGVDMNYSRSAIDAHLVRVDTGDA